jgi:hypothetical protein
MGEPCGGFYKLAGSSWPVFQSAWSAYQTYKPFCINAMLNYAIQQTPNTNPYILWMQIALYGRVCTNIKIKNF